MSKVYHLQARLFTTAPVEKIEAEDLEALQRFLEQNHTTLGVVDWGAALDSNVIFEVLDEYSTDEDEADLVFDGERLVSADEGVSQ